MERERLTFEATQSDSKQKPAHDEVTARFATFNTIDRDGDVTMLGAFGRQEVRPAAWSHNWGQPIIGRGTIRETRDAALFDGEFFLGTTAGLDTYRAVKRAGNLQRWSYGFDIYEMRLREPEARQSATRWGGMVREVVKHEVFEVSPVLLGARVATRTERITSNATTDAVLLGQLLKRLRSGEPLNKTEILELAEIARVPVDEVATIRDCAGKRGSRTLAPSADTPAAPADAAAPVEGTRTLIPQAATRRPLAPGATRTTGAPRTWTATTGAARRLGGHRHA